MSKRDRTRYSGSLSPQRATIVGISILWTAVEITVSVPMEYTPHTVRVENRGAFSVVSYLRVPIRVRFRLVCQHRYPARTS